MIKIGDKYFSRDSIRYTIDTITNIIGNVVYYSCYQSHLDNTTPITFAKNTYESLVKSKHLIKIENEEYIKFLYAKH